MIVIAAALAGFGQVQAATIAVDFEDVVFAGVSTASGVQTSNGIEFAPTATGDLVRVQRGAGTCAGGCVCGRLRLRAAASITGRRCSIFSMGIKPAPSMS